MKFEDGKYEVVFDERGLPQQVLRYGEPWRDLVGDKFMYLVFSELNGLQERESDAIHLLNKLMGYKVYLSVDESYQDNCTPVQRLLYALEMVLDYAQRALNELTEREE